MLSHPSASQTNTEGPLKPFYESHRAVKQLRCDRLPGEVEVEWWVTRGTFDHYQDLASCVRQWAFYKPNQAFLCLYPSKLPLHGNHMLGFAHRYQRVPQVSKRCRCSTTVDEKFKCNPSSGCWDICVRSRSQPNARKASVRSWHAKARGDFFFFFPSSCPRAAQSNYSAHFTGCCARLRNVARR